MERSIEELLAAFDKADTEWREAQAEYQGHLQAGDVSLAAAEVAMSRRHAVAELSGGRQVAYARLYRSLVGNVQMMRALRAYTDPDTDPEARTRARSEILGDEDTSS